MRKSSAAILISILACALALDAGVARAGTGTATLVRIVHTSRWSPPSPDPSGIARVGSRSGFVVVDGEVDETPTWRGSNVWRTRVSGSPFDSWSTRPFSREPTDVAVVNRGRLFISDDNAHRVYEIRWGRDRRFGTRDDIRTSLSTMRFRASDPEGVAYGRGTLFVSDGATQRILRIGPGPDGRFGGGTHDVLLSRIRTRRLGLTDPEGVTYAAGHLYIISRRDLIIVRTTLAGAERSTYSIEGTGIDKPSGIAILVHDGRTLAYVTDRATDNAVDRNENDGAIYIYELS